MNRSLKTVTYTIGVVMGIILLLAAGKEHYDKQFLQGSAVPADSENLCEEMLPDTAFNITDEELYRIQSECTAISALFRKNLQQAGKILSGSLEPDKYMERKTIDEMENLLMDEGYAVMDSHEIYPEYLAHADSFRSFWERVSQNTDGETSFWGVTSGGELYYRSLQFTDSMPYGVYAAAGWNENGELTLTYACKREILYWNMTADGNFIYQDERLDRHWDAAYLLRLHPVDHALYDLNRKYILPIGYHNVNLFLLDWNTLDYGNVSFNDLLDRLYLQKNGVCLDAGDYPRRTDPYPYSAIPAAIFEDTILPHFDISKDEFRRRALYDAADDSYPWQDIECDNILYYPSLIPEVTECKRTDRHTIRLVVSVICPDYHADPLFVHEVTIRLIEDGGYQYTGNQITYRSDMELPSPQARLPLQRFITDDRP